MIFVDTNVVSETLRKVPDPGVVSWLKRYDPELALSTVVIAEIAFGIEKIRPDQRADRLEVRLTEWRRRYTDRIYGLTEQTALLYGKLMGAAALRGRGISTEDGMIAAIALANGGRLATRNPKDFEGLGLELVSPWEL